MSIGHHRGCVGVEVEAGTINRSLYCKTREGRHGIDVCGIWQH